MKIQLLITFLVWEGALRYFIIPLQAFNDKSYAVESNQARWISELVDFFVDSIVHSSVSD